MVARDMPIAVATPASDPDMRVTSAASMAMSVPVPMASPTSACARAGASLMPSPVMPTRRPPACSRATSAGLVLGAHLGEHPGDADLPGDRLGGGPGVAGDHHHVQAQRLQGRDGGGRVVLDRVGDRDHPGRAAVDGDEHGGLALGGERGGAGGQAGESVTPASCRRRALPASTWWPVDGGAHALPGDRLEPGRARHGDAPCGGAGHDGRARGARSRSRWRRPGQAVVRAEALKGG